MTNLAKAETLHILSIPKISQAFAQRGEAPPCNDLRLILPKMERRVGKVLDQPLQSYVDFSRFSLSFPLGTS